MAKRPRGTFRPFRKPAKPEPLGDILSAWLERSGLMRPSADQQIRRAWVDTVGEVIAQSAQPTGFRAGVLTITVANSPLLAELSQFRSAELLAAVKGGLKGVYISKIRFRLGRLPQEKPTPSE